MTRVVYNTATSLNGYIADEAGSLAWLFAVETGEAPPHDEFMHSVGAIVEGSTTYRWVLHEAALMQHPEKWHEFFGELPVWVFTTRELDVPDGADVRCVSGDVDEHIEDIVRSADGRDVWLVGGGELAGQFFDADALDEIQVSLAPAALQGGAPLFPRCTDPGDLELEEVKRYGNFVHLTYNVQPDD